MLQRVDALDELEVHEELHREPDTDRVDRARDELLFVRPRRRSTQELEVEVCLELFIAHEEVPVLSLLNFFVQTQNVVDMPLLARKLLRVPVLIVYSHIIALAAGERGKFVLDSLKYVSSALVNDEPFHCFVPPAAPLIRAASTL